MRYIWIVFFLFPALSNAQSVKYAFQSAKDKNQMVFVKSTDRKRVILYVSEKCRSCISSLKRMRDKLIDKGVSVVISTNNLNYLRNLVKKNAPGMNGLIYYDPGRRFEKDLGLKNTKFSYVIFSEGSYKKYDGTASMVALIPQVFQ